MSLPNPENPYSFDAFVQTSHGIDVYASDRFLADLLAGSPQTEILELGRRMNHSTADPPFQNLDPASRRRAVDWEAFVVDLFHAYQETALGEVGPEPILSSAKISQPELWR